MKIFNIAENFKKNFFASLFLYIGICIIILSLLKCFDPATYSAEIRKERANKRYSEATRGKSANSLTSSDYSEMQSAMDDTKNADESPIGFYIGFILFGGAMALVSNRELTKFSNNT